METKITVFEGREGKFCLTITDTDDETAHLFEERELQGGGYTWEGIVISLVEMRMPNALRQFEIGAEGDDMYVYCKSREPLDQLAQLISEATSDRGLLIAAIENAGDDIE